MIPKGVLIKILMCLIVITTYLIVIYFFNVSKFMERFKFTRRSNNQVTYNDSDSVLINRKYENNSYYETAPLPPQESKNDSIKYILMWTQNDTYPFIYLKEGQDAFVEAKCEYTNCYVTNDRKYLAELTDWDAVLFHGPEFTWDGSPWWHGRPDKRSPHQRYIYACIESAYYYPSRKPWANDYFNWTWTYKVDSDVRWGYMGIRDLRTKKVIGPVQDSNWYENMTDISEEMKNSLKTKSRAAAWFVSNCNTASKREIFAQRLANSLHKYGHTVDVYGRCGRLNCQRDSEECFEMLKNDYFFYLSFENSFSEDYVTEKFIHPLKHNAVPVVWGGANYSRFAPPQSYIDATMMKDPDEVAKLMDHLINDMDEYAKYFRWTKYYSYQRDVESPDTHAFCLMCRALNDPIMMSTQKIYKDFNSWWNR